MRAKKLVFVNQSSGYLMIDIVDAFAPQYAERVLITGLLNPRNKAIDSRVKVENMIPYNRSSSIKRLFTWGLGFLKALWLIKTKYRNADLFLVSNPPFAPLIPLFCSNSYKILIYDIYPDAFVKFGYLNKDSLLVKLWEKANQKIFAKATKVYTLTEEMKTRVMRYANEDKIKIVPIWTDNSYLKPIPKEQNPFIEEKRWKGKFIVMYSGNMGKSHPVEILVELANKCLQTDVHFVIIGGGDKYEMLCEMILESELSNIEILPWQPTEKLPFTLASADIGIVTIGDEAADLSIPSKTFNLMSVGVPILGISPQSSALADLINMELIGKNFEASQLHEIIEFILYCYFNHDFKQILIENTQRTSLKFQSDNANLFI